MKKSAKMTETMIVKAFGDMGRNRFEIAVIRITADWLDSTKQSAQLLEMLNLEALPSHIARNDDSVAFLMNDGTKVPFYEQWFANREFAFLEAQPEEIEQLYKHFHCIMSDALVVHSSGIAHYEAFEEIAYRTVDFDLKKISDILKNQN
ncbi:hypothetical protein [Sphingobacterium siyangense]|uniref:hypothetical protein n=1 Tax=Sphingobacterium siyangense TaxID=459529 RepID=UPI002FDE3732